MQALADELRAIGRAAGLDAVGIAGAEPFADTRAILEQRKQAGLHGGMQFTYRRPERSTDPAHALPGARALVVGARFYGTTRRLGAMSSAYGTHRAQTSGVSEDDDDDGPRGRVAAYARADHYGLLRAALTCVADALERAGWKARVLVDDNALVDRAAAHRAGLGWFGKNTNLLLPGAGSAFVLGSVVTDAPLPTDTDTDTDSNTDTDTDGNSNRPPPMHDGCGPCTRCLSACPTGALVEPGVLDARRCLAWLVQQAGVFPREFRVALGDRIYGCDDCQDVCPPNRVELRRRRTEPDDERATPADPSPRLLDIVESTDDDALLDTYSRWYVPRREARYLKRNALVALGNVGDGRHPRTAAALGRALADDDPIVRAHAVWAAARLGRRDLIPDPTTETDEAVRAELGALPPARRA